MKRFLILFLILGLVFGSIATADAGKKKKKKKKPPPPYTVEGTYDVPAIGTAGAGISTQGLSFPSNDTHVWVTVEITDDVSPTAHGSFSWDTDGDDISDTGFVVCGSTPEPVQVPPNTTINAFIWGLPGPDCPTGFSTSGTVKMTFSAIP